MKKFSIPIIIFLIIASFFIIFFSFFYKGKVEIQPSPAPANITVGEKTYEDKSSLSLTLSPGTYQITIEKEGFNIFEKEIKLGAGKKIEIKANLEISDETRDKQAIEKTARGFTEAWYTYETQTSKDYLDRIKPFVTQELYDNTYYTNTERPQDFKGETPLKTTVSSTDITSYSNEEAEATVTMQSTETTTGKSYEHKTALSLIKQDNKWLVKYLEPTLEE